MRITHSLGCTWGIPRDAVQGCKTEQCGTVLHKVPGIHPVGLAMQDLSKPGFVFHEMSAACGSDASNANEVRGLASCFSLEGRAA